MKGMMSGMKEDLLKELREELKKLRKEDNDTKFNKAILLLDKIENEERNEIINLSNKNNSQQSFIEFNQLLKTILDIIPGAIFWKDANLKFKYGNRKFLQIIGYSSLVDIKGKTDYDLHWTKMQSDRLRADDIEILKAKKPKVDIEEQLTRADGSTIWLKANKAPIINENGDVEGIIGVVQDITESRFTKQALKHSEARLKSYFNNATDGILVLNQDFEICDVNNASEIITGLKSAELLEKKLFDLLCNDDSKIGFDEKCLSMGINPISWEGSVITPNGKLKFVELDVIKIEIDHFICFIKDISAFKLAVKKAEESNRLKTAFLQNISHEIRTPLNAIIGFSNVLLQGLYESEEDAHQYKKIIHSNSGYLLALINNVIDLSKIESGQTNLNPKQTSIIPFINNEVLPLIESERIRLSREEVKILYDWNSASMDLTMNIDNNRLKQILVNLMQNSLKFTDKGFVKLKVEQLGEMMVRFKVSDTGIGIPKDQINRVFHRFYKVQDLSKISQGSGLGLAIVKRLLYVMKGDITVTSEVGKGSEFVVDLPINIF